MRLVEDLVRDQRKPGHETSFQPSCMHMYIQVLYSPADCLMQCLFPLLVENTEEI